MYVPFPRRDHTGNAQTEQVYIKLLSISWSVVTDPADVETEQQPSISSLDPKAIPTLCTQTPPSGCHRGYKKKKQKNKKQIFSEGFAYCLKQGSANVLARVGTDFQATFGLAYLWLFSCPIHLDM